MRPVRLLFLVGGLFFGLLLFIAALLTVARMDLVVAGTGTLEPRSWRYITPEVRGIVKEVLKDKGDTVQQGEIIARLDAADAEKHLAQAAFLLAEAEKEEGLATERQVYLNARRRAAALELVQFTVEREKATHRLDMAKAARRGAEFAVSKAEKAVAASKIRLEAASRECDDQERLAAAGLVSERLVDRARNVKELARIVIGAAMNDLAAAREGLAGKKADEALSGAELEGLSELPLRTALDAADFELKRGKVLLEQARVKRERLSSERDRLARQVELHNIRAPMTGRIEKIYLFEGEMSGTDAAGDISQVVGMVAGEKGYDFVADIPHLDVVKVRVGQDVEVRMRAYPYRRYGSFAGKVASLERSSDSERFRVKIRLDESIYPLRAGMGGYARIMVGRVRVLSYLLGRAENKELEKLRRKADELGSATIPYKEPEEKPKTGGPAQEAE